MNRKEKINMRILVTGGTGFIGSHIANFLTEQDHEVIVMGTKTEQCPKAARYLGLHCGLNAGGYPDTRMKSLGNIDVCFHQAANNDTLDMDRDEMMFANFEAPKSLFYELRRGHNCTKFVYASSSAVYGNSPAPYKEGETAENPLNPYGESKMEFDKWAMQFGESWYKTSVVGLRYTNVYGPGESHKGRRASMIYQLARKMMDGQPVKLFKYGEQKRDWIYVKDVVRANIAAMNFQGSGIFNCGSGRATTFNDLIVALNKKLGTDVKPEYVDCPFVGAYQEFTQADMTKAKEKMGFAPAYDIVSGISELVEAMK